LTNLLFYVTKRDHTKIAQRLRKTKGQGSRNHVAIALTEEGDALTLILRNENELGTRYNEIGCPQKEKANTHSRGKGRYSRNKGHEISRV
jgi:hypothetical protein